MPHAVHPFEFDPDSALKALEPPPLRGAFISADDANWGDPIVLTTGEGVVDRLPIGRFDSVALLARLVSVFK
jgi:hypothetical protein